MTARISSRQRNNLSRQQGQQPPPQPPLPPPPPPNTERKSRTKSLMISLIIKTISLLPAPRYLPWSSKAPPDLDFSPVRSPSLAVMDTRSPSPVPVPLVTVQPEEDRASTTSGLILTWDPPSLRKSSALKVCCSSVPQSPIRL